jgi:hypothetical protein
MIKWLRQLNKIIDQLVCKHWVSKDNINGGYVCLKCDKRFEVY